MVTVTIDRETIRISLAGMDQVWALKRGLEIPLAHVRSVSVAPPDLRPRGLRAPGTSIPGRFFAGTWRGRGSKEFWFVHVNAQALVLDLAADDYTRVIVEVADPSTVAAEIEQARQALTAAIH